MSTETKISQDIRITSPVPIAFILLWSSGYIGGAFGVRYGEPFTMTFYRFALAAIIFLGVALKIKSKWPKTVKPYMHAVVVGVLLQALQFGGLYTGISRGVPAGQAALIVGLMPIFVIIGASLWLGEKLNWRDLPGSLLGVGGVAIVVASSLLERSTSLSGYAAVCLALVGITTGTLYQKKFLSGIDLWVGCFIQMVTASIIMFGLAYFTETMHVTHVVPYIASIGWVTLMNSVGALTLLYIMIRRGETSKATNLFHVIPATTQIMASLTLGEIPSGMAILGFIVSGAGVYLMNHQRNK
ncbi:DMT family transporter [Erwinia sp. BNK-24-b]|uniref:DMT family transporter n=1 Tax=unclassified Erwinia TaxID=2622719 RepID=UPI0039BFE2C4